MFWVLKIISILALICIVPLSNARRKVKVKHGPSGMNINESTTCEEFAKYARFNPYSVLDQLWFVFYYWGPPKPIEKYVFTFPSANHTKYLHKILDGNTILPINWKARQILMEDQNKEVTLLVERGDRGQYWGFILQRVRRGQKIRPRDIRLKQTGDNKLLGLMDCDKETVIAMCKLEEVPPKNRLQDEAARLGYRARRGKSYLYEGHEWMPIPEADEKMYWAPKKKEKSSKQSSNESNEVASTSKEETDKTTDETSNVSKEQMEDQSSQEQVNKDSNNQKNLETSDEIYKNEISEELVEENNKINVTSWKDERDESLTNYKNNNKQEQKEEENKPEQEEEKNKPKQKEEENKPKQEEEKNKPKQEEETNKPKQIEETNKPKQKEEENRPKQEEEKNKPKQEEETNKPKQIEETNKPKQKEEENKPKQEEEKNKPKQGEEENKPKQKKEINKPKHKVGKNKPKQKQGKNKPKQKGGKNKQKRPQKIIEPEVITAQEEEEMKLMMTSEPYSPQNSDKGKNNNFDNKKDSCKSCFTLTQRRRQSIKPNLELDGPEAQEPLENQPNPQAMETKQENKASDEVEKVSDDSKEINTDKNEV